MLSDTDNQQIRPNLGTTIYEIEGYAGNQILVLIGSILIDKAVGASVEVRQNKVPVYGYGSPYYSFAADGQVSVAGDLTVAFKESGYLLHAARHGHNSVRRFEASGSVTGRGGTRITTSYEDAVGPRVLLKNVEQSMKYRDGLSNNQTLEEARKSYDDELRSLAALPDDEFEDWAEAFEDVVWHGADRDTVSRDKMFSKNLTADEEITDRAIKFHRRLDQYPPVDIYLLYGDPNHPAANHTVRKILDASFTGQVQVIEANGQPVLERYSFIARNFV